MPFPIAAAAQGVLGLGQAIIGGISARKRQKELEGMIDSYKPSTSIMDYYSKALNKYNANPYTSSTYTQAMKGAGRGLATGISASQDRRGALGNVSSLVSGYDDASLKAASVADQQQSQDLAQLGQATGMKDREDKYKFEAKYNLLSQKAGAANATANAGISNLYGGLGGIQDYAMINKMYGTGKK